MRIKSAITKRPAYPKGSTLSQRRAYRALQAFCLDPSGTSGLQVLSGYAGTGKTWLAVHLIEAACASGLRVAVCAPTHKAVSVMTAKLPRPVRTKVWSGTLHALLGLRLRETHEGVMRITLDRHPKTLYFESYDIVFIDESSMVGPDLLAYIERFVRGARTRVLYIGDPGQLLPVEDGSAATDPQQRLALGEGGARTPPVFAHNAARHDLIEVVRQKATGRPHPIIAFAGEIRRYIEGEVSGVFDPEAIGRYLATRGHDMPGVHIARAAQAASGAVTLRRRRPTKDIRVIAWRNRIVEERNRFIHQGLLGLYEPGHTGEAPFWPGETLIARETLYAFRSEARMAERAPKIWEEALAPIEGDGSPDAADRERRDALVDLVANNTELTVTLCEPLRHPYLDMPSWRVHAKAPGAEAVELYVAHDPAEYQRLVRKTWAAYRTTEHRAPEDFRRAWAVTRACAPVMHAYAMTAHKAQGSTFHYALVDVADLYGMAAGGSVDDYHRALYVAVTRAAEQVWLCL
ncbi:ATP-dependent RecD-like DNA helicase [Acidiferrobacter sp.]|uniref:ATP-dependent DNA helicase n=1 Tax=Acidiferrobacter sp. TaxID=1872107 RepID=UPI002620EC4C|nr:ATP-dependent DNA helicase [Acidiferrobacter sp.]